MLASVEIFGKSFYDMKTALPYALQLKGAINFNQNILSIWREA